MIKLNHSYFSRKHAIGVLAAFFILCSTTLQAQKTSLLWEVKKKGEKEVSYVYGTMHSPDSTLFEEKDVVFSYLEKCDVFRGELDFNEEQDQMALAGLMMATEPLSSYYSEEDFALIEEYLNEKLGEMAPMLTMLKPFWIMATVVQLEEKLVDMEDADAAFDQGDVIDVQLQRHAELNGIEVSALESMKEQMEAIDAISLTEQAEMLLDMVKKPQEGSDMSAELKEAYRNKDLNAMHEIYSDERFSSAVETVLIDVRNEKMVQRMIASMKEGKAVFCAVGALHLAGDTGLLERLQDEGYKIKPIKY